ncbi:hypothetical protein ACLOJK_010373 [Asimina triloba]
MKQKYALLKRTPQGALILTRWRWKKKLYKSRAAFLLHWLEQNSLQLSSRFVCFGSRQISICIVRPDPLQWLLQSPPILLHFHCLLPFENLLMQRFFPISKPYVQSLPLVSQSLRTKPPQVLGKREDQAQATASITIDNAPADPPDGIPATCFVIRARNKIGLLQIVTRVFKVFGLKIEKASVEFEEEFLIKRFFVTDSHGKKIEDSENLDRIEKALLEALGEGDSNGLAQGPGSASRGVVRKVGLLPDLGDKRAKAERMFSLMDGFLKNDPLSLQKDILNHVEYTVARSRFNFDDFEAYQALSHSVRDRLIERCHDTQQFFKRKDPKRLYFLSLEFLMASVLDSIARVFDMVFMAASDLGVRISCCC